MSERGDSNIIAREYFDSLLVENRYIDSVTASTEVEIFGHKFATPIAISALSHLAGFGYGENGMTDAARAAKLANAIDFVGMGSESELEAITATGARAIKIIKPYADRSIIYRKLEHAERSGAFAVGMDVDHSFKRDGTPDVVMGDEMRPITLDELKSFVAATGLPFIVKGVLSASDAEKCVLAGVRGAFVSNHHGIAKFMPPPAMMLPRIREIVSDMTIFLDGIVESGYDAFKALALGANAVAVGRAVLEPIKQGGAEGAAKWLSGATDELRGAMSRSGCKDVSDIDVSHIITLR